MYPGAKGAQSSTPITNGESVLFVMFCLLTATSMLALGVIFYLTSRTYVPAPLEILRTGHHRLIGPGVLSDSLPDFFHAAALTCMTCALFRPGVLIVLSSAAVWATIDVVWEYSCADQQAWLRFAGARLGITGHVPNCTYDPRDIAAAIAGAVMAAAIILLFQRTRVFLK